MYESVRSAADPRGRGRVTRLFRMMRLDGEAITKGRAALDWWMRGAHATGSERLIGRIDDRFILRDAAGGAAHELYLRGWILPLRGTIETIRFHGAEQCAERSIVVYPLRRDDVREALPLEGGALYCGFCMIAPCPENEDRASWEPVAGMTVRAEVRFSDGVRAEVSLAAPEVVERRDVPLS